MDGTIEFYTRINALLGPTMAVLDFGAGRGAALTDGYCDHRKKLMTLRGKVAKVVACDIDEAVLSSILDAIRERKDGELNAELHFAYGKLALNDAPTLAPVCLWVFDDGRLVEDGPPADVVANPRSERARAFFTP